MANTNRGTVVNSGLVAAPWLVTEYNADTANVDLITDLMYYVRRSMGMTFGCDNRVEGLYHTFGWSMDQFTGVRPTPIRMPRAYIEENKLVSQKVFTTSKVMQALVTYPGISNRNQKKYREGIRAKMWETGCDSKFMAMNPSDRAGDSSYELELAKVNIDLKEAYLAFIDKKNWGKVHEMIKKYEEDYPEIPLFKSGMTVEEQFLAHLDSAGYFLNRAADFNNIKGLVSLKDTYVSSFTFEEKIREKYKDRVKHYFDDILVSKGHAESIKMYYNFRG